MLFNGQGAMGFGAGGSHPNDSFNTDYRMGSKYGGMTKRVVTPGGYQDTYGGLSGDQEFQLGMAPTNFKREVFGQVFPLISGLAGQAGGNGFGADFGKIGGENTPLPKLPNSFVYSPEQIAQQKNAAFAQGDQGALTQKQQIQSNLTGRGFSTRSPLAMAMNQAADTGARAQNQDAGRQIDFNAAGANANQALQVGNLAQHAWSDWNTTDVNRRKSQADSILGSQRNLSSLIAALSGLG